MRVDIISPEKMIFSGDAKSITLPGSNGSFQLLDNHAPIISTLVEGVVEMEFSNSERKTFEIKGGVVEVRNNKVSLLAD